MELLVAAFAAFAAFAESVAWVAWAASLHLYTAGALVSGTAKAPVSAHVLVYVPVVA